MEERLPDIYQVFGHTLAGVQPCHHQALRFS